VTGEGYVAGAEAGTSCSIEEWMTEASAVVGVTSVRITRRIRRLEVVVSRSASFRSFTYPTGAR